MTFTNKPQVPLGDVEAALGRRARVILSNLRNGAGGLAKTVILREARLREIAADAWHNDDWRRVEATQARDAARAELDRLTAQFTAEHAELLDLAKARFAAPVDPTERLAWLMEEDRAWRRAEAVLTAADDPLGAIEGLLSNGGAPMLRALRQELPTFFALRDVGKSGAMQAASTAMLDRLEGPLLTAEQKVARQVQVEAKRGQPRLATAAAYAAHALQKSDQGSEWGVVLPSWVDGDILTL